MGDQQDHEPEDVIRLVGNIVAAYVSHNAMRSAEMPEFIAAIHDSLSRLTNYASAPIRSEAPPSPAVAIKRSVHKDYIVCLEDGLKFKSLRRHLSSFHHLTPGEYRAKWGLPPDYPMVAPTYSATRSQLAKESGLGQVSRRASQDAALVEAEVGEDAAAKKPRGRPRKAV